VNDIGLLFEVEDVVLARPSRSVPVPVVTAFPAAYAHDQAFADALQAVRALPAFG
jgi:hypothetical protein